MKTERPDVTLTYKKVGDKYEWWMSTDTHKYPKGPGNYDTLHVGKGNDGIFTFAIKTKGIGFDPINPIEIKVNGEGQGSPDQFITKIVNGVLVVADPNTDRVATEYYYKLNFDNGTFLDPIISNGCCKTSDRSIQLLSAVGVVTVLAVATALASLYIAWFR